MRVISDIEMAKEIKNIGAKERRQIIDKANEEMMKEVRKRIKRKEIEMEYDRIVDEIFSETLADELPYGAITGFASDDILNK